MNKITPLLRYSLMLLLLGAAALAAGPKKTKVAYIPLTVGGDYRPLDTPTVNKLMMEAFKSNTSEIVFVPLKIDSARFDPDKALSIARANGVDLIAWGNVRFQRSSKTTRDKAMLGKLIYLITTTADVQVASVSQGKRIVIDPVIVTAAGQSNAMTETDDPKTEKKLAVKSLQDAAKGLVRIVRKRRS